MSRRVGPTGKFPYGKLNKHDEGELQIALAADTDTGVVRIDFGKPTAWIALEPDLADNLADMIRRKAADVRKGHQ